MIKPFHSRCRRRCARRVPCVLTTGLLIISLLVSGSAPCEERIPEDFPITFIGGGKPYIPDQARHRDYGVRTLIAIESISTDGKWAYLNVVDAQPEKWFFDIERRQFVGHVTETYDRQRSFEPVVEEWRPDRLLVKYAESLRPWPGSTPNEKSKGPVGPGGLPLIRRMSILEVDALTRQSRVLATCDETMPMVHETSGRAFPNPQHTKLALTRNPLGNDVHMVWDLETNERHKLSRSWILPPLEQSRSIEFRGWMPDGESLIFRDYNFQEGTQFLFMAPPAPSPFSGVMADPRRSVPLAQQFNQLREKGVLTADEDKISYVTYLGPVDGGRAIRLFVLFACPTASTDPKVHGNITARGRETEASVWDFDLQTRKLKRVMNLGRNAVRRKMTIFSPSGTAALDLVTTLPETADRTRFHMVRPALYARETPLGGFSFEIPLPAYNPRTYTRLELDRNVRFIDDHTLLFVGEGYSLWKYDMRTDKSELLWQLDIQKAERGPARPRLPVPPPPLRRL